MNSESSLVCQVLIRFAINCYKLLYAIVKISQHDFQFTARTNTIVHVECSALHTFWRERVAYFNYITVHDKVPTTTTTYEHDQIMAEYFYFWLSGALSRLHSPHSDNLIKKLWVRRKMCWKIPSLLVWHWMALIPRKPFSGIVNVTRFLYPAKSECFHKMSITL